jgi:hypothetical protein
VFISPCAWFIQYDSKCHMENAAVSLWKYFTRKSHSISVRYKLLVWRGNYITAEDTVHTAAVSHVAVQRVVLSSQFGPQISCLFPFSSTIFGQYLKLSLHRFLPHPFQYVFTNYVGRKSAVGYSDWLRAGRSGYGIPGGGGGGERFNTHPKRLVGPPLL